MAFPDAILLGKLQGFFLTHRMVRTTVPKGKSFKEGEKDIAEFIRHEMTGSERGYLMDLFSSFGFTLKVFDGKEYPGIPIGGQVWCLVRDPTELPPKWMSSKEILDGLAEKTSEPRKTTVAWTFIIYLHYLVLTYTRLNRHPNEVSRFVDAVFSREELTELVHRFVNGLGETDSGKSEIVGILTSEKGQEVDRRVARVLDWLCGINHLEYSKVDDAYSQTILGAAEIAEHYESDFAYLFPPDTESISQTQFEAIIRNEFEDSASEEL